LNFLTSFLPTLPHLGWPALEVIGDSLTAGMGQPGVTTWPKLLEAHHEIAIHDHSEMGANVQSAAKQAAAVSPDAQLVLLEIGGNDILGETTPKEFEAGLDRLLAKISNSGRVVVLLELPLPPSYNVFGLIQRRLAKRYGVYLVPKRVVLAVLEVEGSTVDTVHLSQAGHQRMANAVWNTLEAVYATEKQ
jgi:acyl-CoA thioesterase-1